VASTPQIARLREVLSKVTAMLKAPDTEAPKTDSATKQKAPRTRFELRHPIDDRCADISGNERRKAVKLLYDPIP
jgi:hypothetical protein